MSQHSKRRFRRRAGSATGVLAAAAAAVALPGVAGAATHAPAQPEHDATLDSHMQVIKPAKPMVTKVVKASTATTYTVRSGDTLSGIAGRVCGNPADYPALASANGISDPNLIYVDQAIREACAAVTAAYHPSAPARHTDGDGDTDNDNGDAGDAHTVAPVQHAAPVANVTQVSGGIVSTAGMSAMEQCIIQRESGGNAQVMNASGHYGLFQFSASTWAGSGGNPADFGHASAAEQEQVFANAVAARGYSDWTPYDGC